MKKFALILIVIGIVTGVALADDSTKPNLIFNYDTCMLRITPQDGQLLDDWFICVTDSMYIGTFQAGEDIDCEQVVEITPHFSIDMSCYLSDCGQALPNDQLSLGALKNYYK